METQFTCTPPSQTLPSTLSLCWCFLSCSQLQAYVHYIPVANDMSNVVAMAKWTLDHPAFARRVGQRAKLYAERYFSTEVTLVQLLCTGRFSNNNSAAFHVAGGSNCITLVCLSRMLVIAQDNTVIAGMLWETFGSNMARASLCASTHLLARQCILHECVFICNHADTPQAVNIQCTHKQLPSQMYCIRVGPICRKVCHNL